MRNKGLDSVCEGEWCQLSHLPQVQVPGPCDFWCSTGLSGDDGSDQHWEFRQCRGAQRQCFRLHAPFSFKAPKATGHSGSLPNPSCWGGNTAEQRPWEEGKSRLTLHSGPSVSNLHPNARDTKLLLSIHQAQPRPSRLAWEIPLEGPTASSSLPAGRLGENLQTRKQFQELETPVLEQACPLALPPPRGGPGRPGPGLWQAGSAGSACAHSVYSQVAQICAQGLRTGQTHPATYGAGHRASVRRNNFLCTHAITHSHTLVLT